MNDHRWSFFLEGKSRDYSREWPDRVDSFEGDQAEQMKSETKITSWKSQ